MAKKILITAITGSRNHGVEALIVSAVAGLREIDPELHVDVLTQDPEYDTHFLKSLDVRFIDDVWRSRKNALKRELNARIAKYLPFLDKRTLLVKDYDLVLVSGGDMFGPDYGSFDEDLAPLRAAKKYGVPYVFLGQSVGELSDEVTRESFASVARAAELFVCRESLTYEYVSKDLAIEESRLLLLPDPAFLLEVSGDQLRLRDVIFGDHAKPYVTLSVSKGVSTFSQTDEQQHIHAMTRVIDYFTDEVGVRVLLLPHVHESYVFNDDSFIASELMDQVAKPEDVYLAPAHLSATQYKALVAASDFLIAERMHMAIAALSTCTPVYCIGYSIKYRGILGDLFGCDYADENLLISIRDFLESGSVPPALVSAWKDREQQVSKLQSIIPAYKAECRCQYSNILDHAL